MAASGWRAFLMARRSPSIRSFRVPLPGGVVCIQTVGSRIRGWLNWAIQHEVSKLKGQKKSAATELLPRVHRVASLLKRWLLGTHQGAISPEHLDYYLDEFTFRFNRRTSTSRGKLFYRLIQQAVQVPPRPYQILVGGSNNQKHHPKRSVESIG